MGGKRITSLTLDELIVEFKKGAIRHNAYLDSHQIESKKVNKNVDRVSQVVRQIEQKAPSFEAVLLQLLTDSEPAVRMYATAYSEKLLPHETHKVLEELKDQQGHIGFSARWRLRDFGKD